MRTLSVVIPSYNHAAFVATAIRSVLNQDYPALELVVVDDCSKDGSPDVIRAALAGAGLRMRVHFEEQEENRGAHATIMRGLSRATGDVLTILNSDDRYEPGRFTAMMAAVAAAVPKESDFIAFTGVRFLDEADRPMGPETGIRQWYDRAMRETFHSPTIGYGLLRNNFSLTSGNLVFTRRLYERVGGFAPYRMCHDWDFLMRATHLVEPIFVSAPLLSYRVHRTNTLHSTQHLLKAEGVPALNTFIDLGRASPPQNRLAPGWANWPLYFDYFIDTYASWFAPEPMRTYLREPIARPVAFDRSWAGAPSVGMTDLGYASQPHPTQDALAFRREMELMGVAPPSIAGSVGQASPPAPRLRTRGPSPVAEAFGLRRLLGFSGRA